MGLYASTHLLQRFVVGTSEGKSNIAMEPCINTGANFIGGLVTAFVLFSKYLAVTIVPYVIR